MPSPLGRPYEVVEGNQEEIRARGRQIDRLGTFLLESADVIDRLAADGASVQDGKAIDRIVEAGAEVVGRFRRIGQWYEEVAPHVRRYGRSVRDTQEAMQPVLEEVDSHRRALQQAREELRELEDRLAALKQSAGAEGAPSTEVERLTGEIAAQRDLVRRFRAARDECGDRFDRLYDQWEQTHDDAAEAIARAHRANGMRDRRRGAVFVAQLAPAIAVPIVALAGVGLATCIGRGPRLQEVGIAPAERLRRLHADEEFARAREAARRRDEAERAASWAARR